jgi:hypothetical protein
MKKSVLVIILLVTSCCSGYGQCAGTEYSGLDISFEEPTSYLNCLIQKDSTDTVNRWQIGTPNKAVFNSAYSPINVIVTDTLNTYKPSDTSVFMFAKIPGYSSIGWKWHTFGGRYYVNSDTLTDYGRIEYSPNKGVTWINLLEDTTGLVLWDSWGTQKPVLSGNSNGWKSFNCIVNIPESIHVFNELNRLSDTMLYRFTFITDSAETYKDGIMFDNIVVNEMVIDNVSDPYASNNLITVYPTPAQSTLRVSYAQPMHQPQIRITNSMGQTIRIMNNYTATDIDISDLPNGVYMLQCADDKVCASKRFVVSR